MIARLLAALLAALLLAPTARALPQVGVPQVDVAPADVPPGDVPPADVLPGDASPADVLPADVLPGDAPPGDAPQGDAPQADAPQTQGPGSAAVSALDTWLEALAQTLPVFENRALVALALLVASVLLARLVDFVLVGSLRVMARRSRNTIDDEIIDSLHGPVTKSVVLAGLWMACHVLEGEDGALLWAHRSLVTLALIVWTLTALRLVNLVLTAMGRNAHRFDAVEERTLPLFHNLAKVLVLGAAVYLLITLWGLDATGWMASAGVAGVVIGFAAKDTLANLFSGIFIVADAPYRVGDYINLDSGHRGRVEHIGLRSTRILTRDDVEITIPNSLIGGGAIINETSGAPRFRIRVKVGVAYGTDLQRARAVLLEVAGGAEHVMPEPSPRVRFRSFDDSSLALELLVWIPHPELRGRVLDALNTGVYTRFAEERIVIPFPQRDVHMRGAGEG
ncbi:MAG: mechanosensitive ion channel family protein [Planctomycetota bacterium]|nr:MAG: mechanosensitive ion channel family protein [Planctomycetota bacterium]